MDFWLVSVFLVIFVVVGGFAAVCAAACAYCLLKLRAAFGGLAEVGGVVADFEERMEILENAERAHAKSADMAGRGVASAETVAELKEQRRTATEEGRAVLLGPGGIEDKKAAFVGLIRKYPRVAESVARSLNRQYGISKFLGMSEAELLVQIQQILSPAATEEKPAQSGGGFTFYA